MNERHISSLNIIDSHSCIIFKVHAHFQSVFILIRDADNTDTMRPLTITVKIVIHSNELFYDLTLISLLLIVFLRY